MRSPCRRRRTSGSAPNSVRRRRYHRSRDVCPRVQWLWRARPELGWGRCRRHVANSTTAREKLKLHLTSPLRQKQTQFASSSSNGGDVTPKLSRHRWHSFLPPREFDQQLGLLFGPFARFCRLHCCPRTRIETCINCDGDSGTMKADALHPLRLAAGRRFSWRCHPA